jgi:F-type H+-transporting ATPase subunit gamma
VTTIIATTAVITGRHGLCGGYNFFMTKKAEPQIQELKAQEIWLDLILIGNKGQSYLNHRTHSIRKKFECTQNPDSKHAPASSEKVFNSFLSSETIAVKSLYTRFMSLIKSTPASTPL